MPPADGLFWQNSAVRFADITDGMSNTAAMSEKLNGDWSNAIVTERTDTFELNDYPDNPDWWNQSCDSLNINDLSRQGNSDIGVPWLEGSHSNLVVLPHQPAEPAVVQEAVAAASQPWRTAPTRAGVNVLLCDGSVRFVPNTISLATWRALGSRDKGEVISG